MWKKRRSLPENPTVPKEIRITEEANLKTQKTVFFTRKPQKSKNGEVLINFTDFIEVHLVISEVKRYIQLFDVAYELYCVLLRRRLRSEISASDIRTSEAFSEH